MVGTMHLRHTKHTLLPHELPSASVQCGSTVVCHHDSLQRPTHEAEVDRQEGTDDNATEMLCLNGVT